MRGAEVTLIPPDIVHQVHQPPAANRDKKAYHLKVWDPKDFSLVYHRQVHLGLEGVENEHTCRNECIQSSGWTRARQHCIK